MGLKPFRVFNIVWPEEKMWGDSEMLIWATSQMDIPSAFGDLEPLRFDCEMLSGFCAGDRFFRAIEGQHIAPQAFAHWKLHEGAILDDVAEKLLGTMRAASDETQGLVLQPFLGDAAWFVCTAGPWTRDAVRNLTDVQLRALCGHWHRGQLQVLGRRIGGCTLTDAHLNEIAALSVIAVVELGLESDALHRQDALLLARLTGSDEHGYTPLQARRLLDGFVGAPGSDEGQRLSDAALWVAWCLAIKSLRPAASQASHLQLADQMQMAQMRIQGVLSGKERVRLDRKAYEAKRGFMRAADWGDVFVSVLSSSPPDVSDRTTACADGSGVRSGVGCDEARSS